MSAVSRLVHAVFSGLVAVSALGGSAVASAQAPAGGSIYTCTDAKGRRLTSDRPILECIDREQKELSPTGTVRRTVKPSLTAAEEAAEEEKQRKLNEEKMRAAEEKKRERALLARYPDRASHDRERLQALQAVEAVIAAAFKRIDDLEDERKKLLAETDFYKSDPSKIPYQLKRRIDDNANTIGAQRRFIGNQEQEKQRVNAKFDEELAKLNQIWPQVARAGTTPAKP